MGNKYIVIRITREQRRFAKKLVKHSIKYHHVPNVFPKSEEYKNRLIGTLGEIVFADYFKLPRPTRSFGAKGGQDHGQDFVLDMCGNLVSVDVKSQWRKNGVLMQDYVSNITEYQVSKKTSKTDVYCNISIHRDYYFINGKDRFKYFASIIGFVSKEDVLSCKISKLYPKGTDRFKANGDSFPFTNDTYEVEMKHFYNPFIDIIEQSDVLLVKQLIS